MVAKGGHTPARVVLQKLEVVQDAAAAGEAGKDLLPAALLLVAVGKVDHGVLERPVLLGQLLEADDDVVLGRRLGPRALGNEGGAGGLKLGVLEDALVVRVGGAALDVDCVAGRDQLLGGRGREAGAVLKGLGLGAGVQRRERHDGVCVCIYVGVGVGVGVCVSRAIGRSAGSRLYIHGRDARSECDLWSFQLGCGANDDDSRVFF